MTRRVAVAAAVVLALLAAVIFGAINLIVGGVSSVQAGAAADAVDACAYDPVYGDGGVVEAADNGTGTGTGTTVPAADTSGGATVAGLTAAQTRNAATIIGVGKGLGVPARGWVIAIATARQEAELLNLASRANPASMRYDYDPSPNYPGGVPPGDHDSVGIFQQRDAWGGMAARMDVAQSARMFFTGGAAGQRGLLDVDGWQTMTIAGAAQAVQVSAFPDAYARWESLAVDVVAALEGTAAVDAADTTTAEVCDAAYVTGGDVVWPVDPATNRDNWGGQGALWANGHTGTDFSTACGTPVRAAHGGTVIIDTTEPWSGPWLVKITLGPGQLTTWYAHMQAVDVTDGQTVAAGQVIGQVGTEGNSTGCHLHFEVHPTGGSIYADNVDPTAWLTEHVGTQVGATPVALTDALRVGTWNLLQGRNPARVRDEVVDLLADRNLDVLAVQEAKGYRAALRMVRGYSYYTGSSGWTSYNSGVLVRDGLTVTDPTVYALGTVPWRRLNGRSGTQPPRKAVAVTVAGLRVLSYHQVPAGSVRAEPRRATLSALIDTVSAWSGPWVVIGDWNATPRDAAPAWTPAWFARRTDSTLVGSGIDFAAVSGATATSMTHVRHGGSDHDPVVGVVQ